MRGATTHKASRRAGLTGGASRETVHDTPAQGVTQSGGYVECSPRRNSLRSGPEDCHGEVNVWPELVVGRRAHCGWEGAAQGGGAHLGCGTQPLETRRRGERVHRMGGVELEQGPRLQERSHTVARQTRRITIDFTSGSACGLPVPQLPS